MAGRPFVGENVHCYVISAIDIIDCIINPRRACAARVNVLGVCVCVCVCVCLHMGGRERKESARV